CSSVYCLLLPINTSVIAINYGVRVSTKGWPVHGTKIRPTSCGPFLWPLAGSNGRQAFLPIGLIGPSGILQACEESGEVDADILI
ncbi:hypothetical protein, partial [Stenotrophomonas acidaminiphila]|uniref:hypothetical protein n=1 Tax=Stenotrophomonas acidaminiphila TaxID=128780 RepID=UPI001B7FF2FE